MLWYLPGLPKLSEKILTSLLSSIRWQPFNRLNVCHRSTKMDYFEICHQHHDTGWVWELPSLRNEEVHMIENSALTRLPWDKKSFLRIFRGDVFSISLTGRISSCYSYIERWHVIIMIVAECSSLHCKLLVSYLTMTIPSSNRCINIYQIIR